MYDKYIHFWKTKSTVVVKYVNLTSYTSIKAHYFCPLSKFSLNILSIVSIQFSSIKKTLNLSLRGNCRQVWAAWNLKNKQKKLYYKAPKFSCTILQKRSGKRTAYFVMALFVSPENNNWPTSDEKQNTDVLYVSWVSFIYKLTQALKSGPSSNGDGCLENIIWIT